MNRQVRGFIVSIDGALYDVRIPNECSEKGVAGAWDVMEATLGDNNPMKRADGMYCWCQNTTKEWELCRNARRFQVGQYSDKPSRYGLQGSVYSDIGYRPILVPLDPQATEKAHGRLQNMSNGEVVIMGSLLMDGKVQHNPKSPTRFGDIPSYMEGAVISFGPTPVHADDAIRWVFCNGAFWADRVLLRDVTWNDLNRNGLVFGREAPILTSTEKKHFLDHLVTDVEFAKTRPPPRKTRSKP